MAKDLSEHEDTTSSTLSVTDRSGEADIEEGKRSKRRSRSSKSTKRNKGRNNSGHSSSSVQTTIKMIVSDSPCASDIDTSDRSSTIVVNVNQDMLEEMVRYSTGAGSDYDGNTDDGSDCPTDNCHLFGNCPCCCDLRRGVIFINSIAALYSVGIILYWVVNTISPDNYSYLYDDDDSVEENIAMWKSETLHIFLRNGIGLIFVTVFGVGGPWDFQSHWVFLTCVWYVVCVIWNLAFSRYFTAMMGLLFLYPNAQLYYVFRTGRLTRENYPIRRQKCLDCCKE